EAHVRIGAGQAAMIGGDEVAALAFRDRLQERLEGIGQDVGGAFLIEPEKLLAAKGKDAAKDQLADPLRMGLGIGEGQARAPRPAEKLPALDTEVNADPFHV